MASADSGSPSSPTPRRVAIVSDAAAYVGPDLARLLAERGHDLVVGDPADGLVDELEGAGAAVEVVTGVRRTFNVFLRRDRAMRTRR